jgi:plasmid maintenance system antidote protein VapI
MTPHQLRAALENLGVSQRWLASRLGRAATTIHRQCTGEWPVTADVAFSVELLLRLSQDQLADVIDDPIAANRAKGWPAP